MSVIMYDPTAVCSSSHTMYVFQVDIVLLTIVLSIIIGMCLVSASKQHQQYTEQQSFTRPQSPLRVHRSATPVHVPVPVPVPVPEEPATIVMSKWYSYKNDWSQIPVGTEIRHTHRKRTLTGVYSGGDQAKMIRKFATEHINTLKASGVMRPNSKVTPKIFAEVEFKGADGEWRPLHTIRTAQEAPPEIQEQLPPLDAPVQGLIPIANLGNIVLERLRISQHPMSAKDLVEDINACFPNQSMYTTVSHVNGRLYSMLIREAVTRDATDKLPLWSAVA